MNVFQVDWSSCSLSKESGLTVCTANEVAQAMFPVAEESIVNVQYPTAGDRLDKRFTVLGKVCVNYVYCFCCFVTLFPMYYITQ